jgi:dephospho-CoA kinase
VTALRIGITGPIGCGKSTVARWLAERGAVVVDADRIAREVSTSRGPVAAAILAEFGDAVRATHGGIDRPALGRIVFSDPERLRALEAIVHPAVRPRIVAAVEAAGASGAPAVVIEAIKLVEGGYAAECDEVWLVTCGPEEQLARLRRRDLSDDDARQRIAAQGDLVARLAPSATRVVDTSGTEAETRAHVGRALDEALAARRSGA